MSQADTMQPKRSVLAYSLGISLTAFAAIVAAILFSGASADAGTWALTTSGGTYNWTSSATPWTCNPSPTPCPTPLNYPGAQAGDQVNLANCCNTLQITSTIPFALTTLGVNAASVIVDVQTGGQLSIIGGTVANGAALHISGGSLTNTGTLTVNSGANLALNTGTLQNNATINVLGGGAAAAGSLVLSGGLFSGAGSTQIQSSLTNATLTIDGFSGSPMTLDAQQITNNGNIDFTSPAAPFTLNNNALITNNSFFNLSTDTGIGSDLTGTIINSAGATFQKTSGTALTPINTIFDNAGTVSIPINPPLVGNPGLAFNGGGTQTGTFTFGPPGTTFAFNGNHTFNPGASFSGTGPVAIQGGIFAINEPPFFSFPGNLTNSGELKFGPGSTTQQVVVNSNYTQTPTGILDVKLNGTTPGTQYDQLLAGGTASLAGTLNATLGFAPANGQTWDIINGKISLTGDFAATNLPIPYATGLIEEVPKPPGPNDVFLQAVAQADLAVTKTGPAGVLDGQNATYTVTVANNGPSTTTATVNDTFTGATFVSVTPGANCSQTGPSQVTCTFAGMPGSTSQIISLVLKANGVGAINNTATATSSIQDSNPANDSASFTTTVNPASADLSVTKTGPASALPSSNITYTITVTNKGPSDATGVVLSDPPSAGLTLVSVSGSGCKGFPCTLGTMTAGQSATVQATYNISKGVTSVTNKASVTATTSDPNTGNNSAAATTKVGSICPTSAPINPFPPDGATNVPTSGSLGWTNVATTYKVYLGPAGSGCSTLLGTTNTSSIAYSGLTSGTQYEWRVEGVKSGCSTLSSTCFTFTAGGCPNTPPTLVAPTNNSTVSGLVTFSWNGVTGAVDYKVFAGVGGAAPTEVGTTTDTTLTTSIDAGQVSWYVVAEFAAPCPPVQSATSSFNACGTSAPIPNLVSEVFTNQTYTLGWTPVNGATKYEVDEARDASFTQGLFTQTVNGTSVQFQHTVSAPTPFFYRVRAFVSCLNGFGPNSQTVRVVLDLIPPPDTPNPNVNVPAGSSRVVVQIIHVPGFPDSTFPFAATVDKPWLQVSPSTGLLPPEGIDLTVTADPTSLPNGTQTGTVIVTIGSGSGPIRTNGTTTVSVPVSISLVTPVSPTKPVDSPPPNALIIAAVGHLDGINSRWQSDVSVSNIASSGAQYELTFTPDDPAKGVKQTVITAGAQATIALSDIVRNWYGVGSLGETANGVLEIRPLTGSGKTGSEQVNVSLTTVASSRTYNVTSNGTLGEAIPATPFANFIGRVTDPGKLATVLGLQQIAQSDNFRTNLGLVEAAGKPVSVLASVFDPSGKKVLDIPVDLKANEQRQLNSFLAQNKIALSNGRIEVKVTGGDGKVTAYASVVDNRSGDPYLVSPVALGQTNADTYVLPGVADVNTGLAAWRTDMTILNSGTVPQLATLTFYAQGSSDTPKSTSMTVNPGELKVLDNVLPSFLATTNAGGAVHVTTPIPSSLVVAGHTYDLTASGTKGQYIQAVTPTESAGKGDRDLQILQVEDSSRYYTNIGIAEVTGKPVTVEVAVVLPDSKVSPKAQIALAANGFFQQDIIQAIGMSNVYNARVTVRVVDGDGKITAYGSVIDQKTRDATYVPAQ